MVQCMLLPPPHDHGTVCRYHSLTHTAMVQYAATTASLTQPWYSMLLPHSHGTVCCSHTAMVQWSHSPSLPKGQHSGSPTRDRLGKHAVADCLVHLLTSSDYSAVQSRLLRERRTVLEVAATDVIIAPPSTMVNSIGAVACGTRVSNWLGTPDTSCDPWSTPWQGKG